jgi:hypothetical protein
MLRTLGREQPEIGILLAEARVEGPIRTGDLIVGPRGCRLTSGHGGQAEGSNYKSENPHRSIPADS